MNVNPDLLCLCCKDQHFRYPGKLIMCGTCYSAHEAQQKVPGRGSDQIFVGIDPGASGCIATLCGLGMKIGFMRLDETEADIAAFIGSLPKGNTFAFLEKVHSMPKQGVSSSFKFGAGYGFLRGCLVAHKIPFEDVTPQRWMKALQCMTGGDKNVTKQKAQQLFPAVKIGHAEADALLIAEYCRRTKI